MKTEFKEKLNLNKNIFKIEGGEVVPSHPNYDKLVLSCIKNKVLK